MAVCINFERCACAEVVGLDRSGREFYVVVVKRTFGWDARGRAIEVSAQPVHTEDVFDGEPGLASPLYESELVHRKPKLDVLLAGEIELPVAMDRIDVGLEVGARLRKFATVFGDRRWTVNYAGAVVPSAPSRFQRMPFSWSRSFGGTDPRSPAHMNPLNPVGRGVAKDDMDLVGQAVPNFESPYALISSARSRPDPVGFGPVGRAWLPRRTRAGTYDERWLEEVFPFVPSDFDESFFNCAPDDQQLSGYQPGETVRLIRMTSDIETYFHLPPFEVAITVRESGGRTTEGLAAPDTVVIEPGARRFSVTGRFLHYPRPNALALVDVLIGKPWPGWLRAQRERKRYVGPDPRENG